VRVQSGALLLFALAVGCGDSDSGGTADAGANDSATGGVSATGGQGAASGSSGSGGRSGSGGGADDSGTDGGNAAGSGGSGGSGFDPRDTACLARPQLECLSCCYDTHSPDGSARAAEAITATRSCACESPGRCSSVCSTTYCVGQPTSGPECYDCVFPTIVEGEACHAAARNACSGDTECAAYVQCRSRCIAATADAG